MLRPRDYPPPHPSPVKGGGSRPQFAAGKRRSSVGGSRPSLREERAPLVVYGKHGNVDLLTAVDAAAERLGLRAGLALAQARAMHPALVADAGGCDRRRPPASTPSPSWCLRYTPLVAIDPPDGILLDIGGCAHLFGGEAALRDDLLARMTRSGFAARAAIAATIGTAWAAARFGDCGHHPDRS